MKRFSEKTSVSQVKAIRFPLHNPLTEIMLFSAVMALFIFISMLAGVIPV
jgi:hypothetical protein